MTLNAWNGLPDPEAPKNLREGEPYNDPKFEELARTYGIWGTAQSALCAQFWQAARRAPAVPQGWKLVPEKSTEAMARAFRADDAPDFSHVATRKLQDLQERGYRVTGYAIEKLVEGGQPERGFITAGGFVGWWRGDDEWRFGGAEKKQN